MFRRLTMAIFKLYMKHLVSSYTGLFWAVNSGTIQEVRMAQGLVCVMEVGRCEYMEFLILYDMSKLTFRRLISTTVDVPHR